MQMVRYGLGTSGYGLVHLRIFSDNKEAGKSAEFEHNILTAPTADRQRYSFIPYPGPIITLGRLRYGGPLKPVQQSTKENSDLKASTMKWLSHNDVLATLPRYRATACDRHQLLTELACRRR